MEYSAEGVSGTNKYCSTTKHPSDSLTITSNNGQRNTYNLRSVDEVPEPYNKIFSNYITFNKVQSSILDAVLNSDTPLVVSAPTGSGKTVIFELAIVRFMKSMDNSHLKMPYKIVYVAPMKALCDERLIDWHSKFSQFGLTCISVTGDSDNADFQSLINHNLIITTPEKWDSLTRRDNRMFIGLVKLFLIDEVHLIGDDCRGPTLEAIVCRMKTIPDSLPVESSASTGFSANIRFVAVSATTPNVEDIAEWLSLPSAQAKSFKFSDDVRPVQLKKVVIGYSHNPKTSTMFKFEYMLNYKLQSIMLQYAEGKPTLIFCNTRKSVEMTSKHLTQHLTINLNMQQKQVLNSAASRLTENKVKEMLANGVSYHHAGLPPEDRKIIEELFRNSDLPILVTTSTLAMGVNLPAHLVIIKSTKYYNNGEYLDYSEIMMQQMIGRAGRPQYDSSATAVILTTLSDKKKFEDMAGGEQCVESSLHKHLTEHLNAEVVLGTITDLVVAMQWLTSTFLHIRARKNPRFYGFPVELDPDQIDRKLLEMCQIEINRLVKHGMLTIDQDVTISYTNTSLLMAKYCIAFDTMKLFTEVSGTEIMQQILGLISKCKEFSDIYLRVNDKKSLNLLNKCRGKETIRYPLNGKIKTIDMKINCIIQAVFGCLPILEQSLLTESQKIMRTGERVTNCLSEYLGTKRNCYSALLHALILSKCFHARLWENSPFVSKQIPGIGCVLSTALATAGKTTFNSLLNCHPRDIERLIGRKPPMGNSIQTFVEHLPYYYLNIQHEIQAQEFVVTLKVQLSNAEILHSHSNVNLRSVMYLLVGDTDNKLHLFEKFTHSEMILNQEIIRTMKFSTTAEHNIKIDFISEDWVGIDCEERVKLSVLQKPIDEHKQKMKVSRIENQNKGSKKPLQTFMETYFQSIKQKSVPLISKV